MMSTHQKYYMDNKTGEQHVDRDKQHARDMMKPERTGPLRRAKHLFEDNIKRACKKLDIRMQVDLINLVQDPASGSFKHGNELQRFYKMREFHKILQSWPPHPT